MIDMIDSFSGEYRFLSNFYMIDVEFEGMVYRSVEHAYQAAKSTDLSIRKHIQQFLTPGKAKRFGKSIEIREDWERVKVGIMYELIRKKFNNEELKSKLLDTGDLWIIEGNNWNDTFWGYCNGDGRNVLGVILMNVRDELRYE